MMISSVPKREMRMLTETEIAMVAAGDGPNEAGVDALVDRGDMMYLSPDGAFVRSSMDTPLGTYATTAFDSDQNGQYDIIWMQMDNGNWICSTDGESWGICSSPIPLIDQYIGQFEEPEEVPEN